MLGKYRSEHEIFDEALENYLNEDIVELPEVPTTEHNRIDEMQHTIRGVITPATTQQPVPAAIAEPAAIIEEADTEPPFPPPPVPGSDETPRSDDEIFPEPNYLNDPSQVHATSCQLSDDRTNLSYKNWRGGRIVDERSYASSTDDQTVANTCCTYCSLTKTKPRHRLRFDSYDHFRDTPTRRAVTEGGYYEILKQQELELPLSKEEKRTILVNTAKKTRHISQSGIPVSNINKTPDKSSLKKRFPERSNRGQPPPSSDIYSASFQLNMSATSIETADLPENVRILQ